MIVLIPAYRPDARLVLELHRAEPRPLTLVVDDGSGPDHAPLFDALTTTGAVVLTHTHNRGKGDAIRTGLRWVSDHHPDATVVTADADGQHLVTDILAVGRAAELTGHFTLGVRDVIGSTEVVRAGTAPASASTGSPLGTRGPRTGLRSRPSPAVTPRRTTPAPSAHLATPTEPAPEIPLRSLVGNLGAILLFRAATGHTVSDTQTGLRAFPPQVSAWAGQVPGSRYEYEMRVLLEAAARNERIDQVPITTVYEDGNRSSHFRPFTDSVRVQAPVLAQLARRGAAAARNAVRAVGRHHHTRATTTRQAPAPVLVPARP